jgi:DNA polymerase-4
MTEDSSKPIRKIVHVDMDAFYASVEQLDNPELRGKPVAVGGSRERGVVAAASYEARKFGVRSAMPSSQAARLCRDLIFVPPRFERYGELSRHIREIFHSWTPLVEPLSLDEAYLDLTENLRGEPLANEAAKAIKREIKEATGLTASAGVSFNKFLAKIASDYRKPDGLFVITPERAPGLIASLPIRKFHGVGPATAKRMIQLGIRSGAELMEISETELVRLFGKAGRYYYRICRGLDDRPVRTDRVRKSVSAERTFSKDIKLREEVEEEIRRVASIAWKRVERSSSQGRTVTIKVRFSDFATITRSRTREVLVPDAAAFTVGALELFEPIEDLRGGIRLIGVGLGSLVGGEEEEEPGPRQLELWEPDPGLESSAEEEESSESDQEPE